MFACPPARREGLRRISLDCRSRALSLTPWRTGVVPRFRSFPKTTTPTTCERRETKVCDQMRRYETSFGGFSSLFLTALMFFSCETLVIQSEVQVFPIEPGFFLGGFMSPSSSSVVCVNLADVEMVPEHDDEASRLLTSQARPSHLMSSSKRSQPQQAWTPPPIPPTETVKQTDEMPQVKTRNRRISPLPDDPCIFVLSHRLRRLPSAHGSTSTVTGVNSEHLSRQ